jgi:hypothetical protein
MVTYHPEHLTDVTEAAKLPSVYGRNLQTRIEQSLW